MSLLFTQDWDIVRGKEDGYAEFVAKQFIPKCDELGLRSVGGFYVQVGVGPQIISIKSVDSLEQLSKILADSRFLELKRQLKEHVANYSSKVLEPTGTHRTTPYEIQKGVWKFNTYFDVYPGKRQSFDAFLNGSYFPALRELDYVEVTENWNVLIGGFSEVVMELTFQDPVDIGRLLAHARYRELAYALRRDYVRNYKSRILQTTERFDQPRWFRL